ncbi:MAG: HAMP domain-containing protein, partial [Geothrix sp.]|nr:HAMP domain-containing protein [Geothrix sp.]
MDPLLAPFRNLQKAILAVGVAGLLVALGLSLRSARTVTAPLKALASAAQALAEGEPPETLALVPTEDEVGVLTRTFRSMLAELRVKDEWLALLETARRRTGGQEPAGAPVSPRPRPGAAMEAAQDEATRRLRPLAGKEGDEPLPDALREGSTFAAR